MLVSTGLPQQALLQAALKPKPSERICAGFDRQPSPEAIYIAAFGLFTVLNPIIERLPRVMGDILYQGTYISAGLFEIWAHPRDLEKRGQAVAVWPSLLAITVLYATYNSRALGEMNLFLSEDMKSLVDDICFWRLIRGNVGRITDAAKEILVKAVMDPYSSPRTNLVLWWLVVTIQSQVHDSQPECPVGGPIKDLVPNLSFDGKLKVLNHYARILTLEVLLHSWEHPDTINHALAGKFLATKNEILTFVNNESICWVDEDAKQPFQQTLE